MNLDFLKKIRRNHALEHATIAIANSRMERPGIVAGNSTRRGFFVYGDVPTELLSQSAAEALQRLKTGERELAITPYCGTNLVVAATLTGLACAWAMGREPRLNKLPGVFSAALMAIVAARPLGLLVQRYVTTTTEVERLTIRDIRHVGSGRMKVHRVRTGGRV